MVLTYLTEKNNTTKTKSFSVPDRIEIATRTIAVLQEYPRIRAILIRAKEKIPAEQNWAAENNYPADATVVLKHLAAGGNLGLTHPSGMSCAIDGDTAEIRKAALSLGNTLEWNTGSPGHFCELFLIKNEPVGNIPLVNGAYIRGKGGQNLAPGSIHPNGRIYGSEVLHLVPPVEITKTELMEAFGSYIVGTEKLDRRATETPHRPVSPNSLLLKDLVDLRGFRQHGIMFQGPHPLHGSTTGTNFVVDIEKNLWHCFRHGTGGGPLQWIAVSTGVIQCEESIPGKIKGDLFWQAIAAAHNEFRMDYEKLVKALEGQ